MALLAGPSLAAADAISDAAPQAVIRAPLSARPRDPSAATTLIEAADYAGELRSVGRLASMVPGVVQRDLGPGQLATLSIRGSTADQLLVSLDGIPLTAPGGGAVDVSRVAPAMVERLEVVRGVVGGRYGPGAMGGALNVITRVPDGAQLDAELAGGSFGTGMASAAGGFAQGAGSYLVAASAGRTAGDFPFLRDATPEVPDNDALLEERRANNGATQGALLGRARWEVPAGSLSMVVTADALERGVPGTVLFPYSRSRMSVQGGLAGLAWDAPAGAVDVSAVGWARADRVQATPEVGAALPQVGAAGGAQLSLAHTAGRHRLLADLALGMDWTESDRVGARRRWSGGLGLLDEIRLGDAWRLALAGRGDQVGGDRQLSARAALTGRAGPARLALGAGRSFRAPTFTELYYEAGPLEANAALRPEVAIGADLTVGLHHGPLAAQVSGFWARYREIIIYETYVPLRARPLNVGAAEMYGAELEGSFRASALPLRIALGYSWLEALNRRPAEVERGKLLPYRAPHRLFGRAAWSGDRLALFADARLSSQAPRNRANTQSLPAQAELSLGAGVRVDPGPSTAPGKGWWLHGSVQNLAGATREDLFGYPLPGRSFSLSLRFNL